MKEGYTFSVGDLVKMNLECLPTTPGNIAIKAKQEKWPFIEVRGKGGPRGTKRIYKLPEYVRAEIAAKGLNYEPQQPRTQESKLTLVKEQAAPYKENIAPEDVTSSYEQWAMTVNLSSFVPVKFYPELRASTGHGAINYDDFEAKALLFDHDFIYHTLKVNPRNLICVQVVGDSMEPTITGDGIAMIDISKQYIGDGIYLIRQGEALKIKRLQQTSHDRMLIISDNKELYTPIEVDLSLVDECEFAVLGRYVWNAGIVK